MVFRTEPKSLEEMLDWGMISYNMYHKLFMLSFEDAKKKIDTELGYQTWSLGVSHIMEYVAEHKVDVSKFTRNEWAKHCIKLSKGKMCPWAPSKVYDLVVQPKERLCV